MKNSIILLTFISLILYSCSNSERVFSRKLNKSIQKKDIVNFQRLIYSPSGVLKNNLDSSLIANDLINAFRDITKNSELSMKYECSYQIRKLTDSLKIGSFKFSYTDSSFLEGEIMIDNNQIFLLEKLGYRSKANNFFGYYNTNKNPFLIDTLTSR